MKRLPKAVLQSVFSYLDLWSHTSVVRVSKEIGSVAKTRLALPYFTLHVTEKKDVRLAAAIAGHYHHRIVECTCYGNDIDPNVGQVTALQSLKHEKRNENPRRKCPPFDYLDPWAFALLGQLSHVTRLECYDFYVASKFPPTQLRALDVHCGAFDVAATPSLLAMTNLTHLGGAPVLFAAGLPHLQSLDVSGLSYDKHLVEELLQSLPRVSRLATFAIWDTLANFTQLRSLCIRNYDCKFNPRLLQKMTNLSELECDVLNVPLTALTQLRRLRVEDGYYRPSFYPSTVEHLQFPLCIVNSADVRELKRRYSNWRALSIVLRSNFEETWSTLVSFARLRELNLCGPLPKPGLRLQLQLTSLGWAHGGRRLGHSARSTFPHLRQLRLMHTGDCPEACFKGAVPWLRMCPVYLPKLELLQVDDRSFVDFLL